MRTTSMLLSFALLAATACGAPMDPASLVQGARVLGVRVGVEGDPARAWPRPGETATATWLVVDTEERNARWMVAATTASGVVVASAEGEGIPTLSFTAPDVDSLELHGIVCAGGTPVIEASGGARCEGDGADGTLVSARAFVQRGEVGNGNPSLAGATVTLDGLAWGEATCPTVVADGSAHIIGIEVPADMRETYAAADGVQRERLQLSHFVTGGELERQFSIVERADDAARRAFTVEWIAPAPEDAEVGGGVELEMVLVARDLRGGTDWMTRRVCVVPAE